MSKFTTFVLLSQKLHKFFLVSYLIHVHNVSQKSFLVVFKCRTTLNIFFDISENATCEAEITFFAKRYYPKTRKWFFEDFNKWFMDPGDSRAYVLLGDAGVGKSVLAGVLAHRTRNAGDLAAACFCRHNDATRNNPRYLLGTIACQLCKCNEQYNSIVGGEVGITNSLGNSALGVQELFTKLLQEPLAQCTPPYSRELVVIDALDETKYESREDFLDLIMYRFPMLPQWLVFFITSRPEDCVQFRLKMYNPCIKICAGNSEDIDVYQQHEQDIKLYLEETVDFSRLPYSVDDVAKKCNGLFLYAFYIERALQNQAHSGRISQLDELIPRDIESFFLQNFRRIFAKIGADLYRKLFGCAVVAPSPLPVPFISFILQRENSSLDEQEVIDALSTFLVFRTPDQTFAFLHNLIPVWLTNTEKASRKLFVDKIIAGEYLRDIINECLSKFLNEESAESLSIDIHILDYVLRVGLHFLFGFSDKVSAETISSCLTSFRFIQARIECRRNGIYTLIEDFKVGARNESSVYRNKQVLQEICAVLERNVHVLCECPKLLNSCLRMTSKAVKDIVIPYGVSTSWMEYSWLRNPLIEIPLGMNCFALSPDKVWLAGGKGHSIFLFDACTLQKIHGPVKVEPVHVIRHLEFSSDSKFLFFGRLDKWFSLELGRLKDFPQFADRNRFCKWGSLALHGRYIVVESDNVWDKFHCQSCVTNLICLWATLELKQIKSDEIVFMRDLIQIWMDCFFILLIREIGLLEGIPEKFRLKVESSESDFIMEFGRDCSLICGTTKFYYVLFLLHFYEHFSCHEKRLSLSQTRLRGKFHETALLSVRQHIIHLYHEIFPYQVWNLESGRSALEEVFFAGTRPHPILFIYPLPNRTDLNKRIIPSMDEVESLCGIAVANAMYYLYQRVEKYSTSPSHLSPRDVWNFSKSVLLNPRLLTHSTNEIPGLNTTKKVRLSLDQKWLAVGSGSNQWETSSFLEVTVFQKISQSERFDYENTVYTLKGVNAFAFTDDCSVLLYLTSKHKSYYALSLQTGTALSSVSGLAPLYCTLEEKVGYCFCTRDEEKTIFARDLPDDFLESVWTSMNYIPQLEIAFSSPDTITSISCDAMLSSWNIANADDPSVKFISKRRIKDQQSPLGEGTHLKNCVFSCCGELLATQRNEAVLLFKHDKFLCTVFEEEDCSISCMSFSADSALLLFCIKMNRYLGVKFLIWDIQKLALSASCDSMDIPSVDCCCLSCDNAKVMICGQLNIQIWEYADHSCGLLTTLTPSGVRSELDKFAHCTFSPNGKLLACCIGDKILLYPAAKQQPALQIPHCHLGRVDFCQFLKGSRYLISYGVDGVVFLWDLNDWQAVAYARITLGKESIVTMAVSPEENKVVCSTSAGRLSLITLCGLKCENLSDVPLPNTNSIGNASYSTSLEQRKEGSVPTCQGSTSHDNLDIFMDDWLLVLSSDENEVESDED